MAGLSDWIGEANDITAPKPLQMAKALRLDGKAVQQIEMQSVEDRTITIVHRRE